MISTTNPKRSTASSDQAAPNVRCAIYTRKSTEEGLEQEFNTLDAQREAAEAYIQSMKHEGWICLPSDSTTAGSPAETWSAPHYSG
ncbi:hypothetical protein KOR42_34410 [Thalassoglobus neptunius]|uniref:Resolvase/invertase-type recombinase catalytic domain-containing protein n=1 Tax=Thalassoglobus neptunius TaxID=1938619 RepID=A0A5C5WLT7_9PLAN|nr:recombinase family protein [Thalassoglobus neptunius]TWT51754.1 hypothetical protein KOR42_34410 [Thalassoglobus neptunius]